MKSLRLALLLLVSVAVGSALAQKAPAGLVSRLTIPAPEITTGGPATEPALAFPATFELANFSSSPVKVQFDDAAHIPVKFGFRLLSASGDVLWSSGELLLEEGGEPVVLKTGQTWKRTVAIPLFIDDRQLEEGRYAVEAFVLGSPDYSSTATFRMTYGPVPSISTVSGFSQRKSEVANMLSVADSKVVVGLRNGSSVRLSGVVNATFSLANRSVSNIPFSFSDSAASQRKIAFSLLDDEGNVLWKSDRDVISLPVMVESTLLAGKTWERTLAIPLHINGTALGEGYYTIVGEIEGRPAYRSATTIRVVNRAERE